MCLPGVEAVQSPSKTWVTRADEARLRAARLREPASAAPPGQHGQQGLGDLGRSLFVDE